MTKPNPKSVIMFTLLITFGIAVLGSLFHTIIKRADAQEQAERQFIQQYKAELKHEQNKETQP